MKISVSAPAGLEGVTKREIFNLIGEDTSAINGRLMLDGDINKVALLNLHLRTASRVYIVLGEFKAKTFDELFEGVKNIPLENYITADGKIEVYGTSVESKLAAISASASIVKKAICVRLSSVYNCQLTETQERYRIEFVIRRDFVTISLNSSGEGLHKRGYRKAFVGEAPLKENIAASLLMLSVWNKSKPLADLFCGSGTIPIEAALIAKNIPTGLNRDFDFLHFKKFDTRFFEEMKEIAKQNIITDCSADITAYDIDESQIKLAKYHAVQAGVDDIIKFECKDMRYFSSDKSYGVIVSNPPYGERLMERKEIVSLNRAFGKVYNTLDNWSCYTLTSVSDFESLFGKKADKKRNVFNGKLKCCYYSVLGAKPPKTYKN